LNELEEPRFWEKQEKSTKSKGATQRWFFVDMHIQLQWANKHLLPLLIDKKWGETKMTPRLAALVGQVVELCDSDLRVCHCTEEFTLQQIRPLSHREKLAYECPRLADPSYEPAASKIFNFAFSC
jgi:hypothetical protein